MTRLWARYLLMKGQIWPTGQTLDMPAVKEQPPHICKKKKSTNNCESTIEQHPSANPECGKTYADENFWIIEQARASFHLRVLESLYIKAQHPVLCRQKEIGLASGLLCY